MAFDEALADRIRDALAAREGVTERKMFGGIAFMVGGKMAVGVMGEDLIVRIDKEESERALAEEHVRPMDFTGRPMRGFVVVDRAGIESDRDFASWVDAGADYAASLPAK
jgi:hypothetical protein